MPSSMRVVVGGMAFALNVVSSAAAGPVDTAKALWLRGDCASAFRTVKPLAEQGDPAAQQLLSGIYGAGCPGLLKDALSMIYWLRQAADQGFVGAETDLGFLFDQQDPVHQDLLQSLFWFRKAADQGDALAQWVFAIRYEKGHGAPRDLTQALYCYRKAADQNEDVAKTHLGALYARGEGVPKNDIEAFKWFRAVGSAYGPAYYHLGVSYENGRGVARDYNRALTHYDEAAHRSYSPASYALGLMYLKGGGVKRDRAQALA